MTRFLVTGGAGFIGSNIVERLVTEGRQVTVVDDFSTGKRENIEPFAGSVRLIEGDICDRRLMQEACRGVDYVLHHAAIPSVPRSIEDPLACNRAAVDGTLSVLLAARDSNVKRVVYASSSSVYGDSEEMPKREEMRTDPLSPYAVGKLAGERYCAVFTGVYGLETVSLRYFNVFGPRQDPSGDYAAVIPKFISKMLACEEPVIYGDGEQTRDFTYVDNVVEGNLLACTVEGVAGAVLNLACGESVSINEVVAILCDILGKEIAPKHEPPRPGDVLHSLADISEARERLGYCPRVSFREGLSRTVARTR